MCMLKLCVGEYVIDGFDGVCWWVELMVICDV